MVDNVRDGANISHMILLVTGARDWRDRPYIFATLDRIHEATPIEKLVEGCADGADWIAGEHSKVVNETAYWREWEFGWAHENGVEGAHYPADWDLHGNGAGPIRNRQMLARERPDLVVAFHPDLTRSTGTADMIRVAREDGIDVHLYTGRSIEPVILRGREITDD